MAKNRLFFIYLRFTRSLIGGFGEMHGRNERVSGMNMSGMNDMNMNELGSQRSGHHDREGSTRHHVGDLHSFQALLRDLFVCLFVFSFQIQFNPIQSNLLPRSRLEW